MGDLQALAREVARQEDQRLVALVATTAALPFRVYVVTLPDVYLLQVRVPGMALAAVGRNTARDLGSADAVAVHLGEQARRAWFATPALPIPSTVVLGEN